jgi:SAM-dependent methyltransferase
VPFIAGDEEFYGILHEQRGYPAWRWDYDLALEAALQPRGKGRILDVGAGSGIFLASLPGDWSVHAVEGSATTRAELTTSGIHVFSTLDEAASTARGTFHVITLFQVLEHLANFRETLLACKSLLVSGGTIVITVPEANAMRRQEEITGCADMPPNHICKWTPGSLALVLQDAGFRPGPPSFEPASIKSILGAIHLQILSDRRHGNSLANRVYRIEKRPLRVLLLGLLALPAFFRIMPHMGKLCRRTAFGMVGTAS